LQSWRLHVYGELPRRLDEICTELGLPFTCFTWQPEMRRAGLLRDAPYLVRPDGYVAWATSKSDAEHLRRFFFERDLQPAVGRSECHV
jgi:hypothetical protein